MAQENMSDRDFAWSIYQHADRLQHQRQYNFATMQAFLFVAVGLGANSSFWEVLVPLVALFGACLAVAWWGATVRLVRPMRAIRRCLETDSVYRVYHSALWKFSASFLVIHLPPTLAFVIWASLLAKALGLAELQGLQYLIPLAAALLLALFLVALERKVESKPPGTDAKQPAPNAAALPPSSGEPGTVNPVVAVILVLFAPSRFVEAAVRHDVYAEFRTNRQWQSAYPDRQVPPEKTQEFRSRARQRIEKIRSAVFGGIVITLAAIASGLLIGSVLRRLVGPAPFLATVVLQIAGAGIILGATLAEVGREIESWKQNTLPEKANRWIFRTLYVFGTFIFVVSIGWLGARVAP